MTKVADDAMLGKIARQQNDLFRRVREGLDPDLVSRGLQKLIEGHFDGVGAGRLLTVDYSVRPSLVRLEVVEHPDRGDTAVIDLSKVERVLTLKFGESSVGGEENLRRLKVRAKKAGETLLDVRVLEELHAHPHLIPEEWKTGVTYFWGTIFRGAVGGRSVPCLIWGGGRWRWGCGWLEGGWGSLGFAAVLRK